MFNNRPPVGYKINTENTLIGAIMISNLIEVYNLSKRLREQQARLDRLKVLASSGTALQLVKISATEKALILMGDMRVTYSRLKPRINVLLWDAGTIALLVLYSITGVE